MRDKIGHHKHYRQELRKHDPDHLSFPHLNRLIVAAQITSVFNLLGFLVMKQKNSMSSISFSIEVSVLKLAVVNLVALCK